MGCIADDAVLPDVCGVLARFEDRVSAIAWSSVCLSDPDSGIPYQDSPFVSAISKACRMERSTLDGVV